jgi:uncharacterized membrane protein
MKSTFWFIPSLIVAVTILAALALLAIDVKLDLKLNGLGRYLVIGSADSARSILSVISGAMIGVAGTVFSVTLVALTLASNQFGSRLIKNFMHVRLNQVVLGSYIATFIYSLIILNAIRDTGSFEFIPSLSILVALLAALLNIILLIAFIHKIATSIQVEHVISDVARIISDEIDSDFIKKTGPDKSGEIDEGEAFNESQYNQVFGIFSKENGYLTYRDSGALIEIMSEIDAVLKLHFRTGEYMVKGEEICTVYSNKSIDEGVVKRILKQFITSQSRTSQQDIEFPIHQMVEIAIRALSPGINDTFTAIACIDSLSAAMVQLSQVNMPATHRYDDDGVLRMVMKVFNFEDLMDAAFNQIRQSGSNNPAVLIKLFDVFATINKFINEPTHEAALKKHIEMVLRLGRKSITEPLDLADLEKRISGFSLNMQNQLEY